MDLPALSYDSLRLIPKIYQDLTTYVRTLATTQITQLLYKARLFRREWRAQHRSKNSLQFGFEDCTSVVSPPRHTTGDACECCHLKAIGTGAHPRPQLVQEADVGAVPAGTVP